MTFYEQIWLQKCPLGFRPKFYRRYVDDILKLNILKNLRILRIISLISLVTFLDILMNRSENIFVTCLHRKPTFTDIYEHVLLTVQFCKFCAFLRKRWIADIFLDLLFIGVYLLIKEESNHHVKILFSNHAPKQKYSKAKSGAILVRRYPNSATCNYIFCLYPAK